MWRFIGKHTQPGLETAKLLIRINQKEYAFLQSWSQSRPFPQGIWELEMYLLLRSFLWFIELFSSLAFRFPSNELAILVRLCLSNDAGAAFQTTHHSRVKKKRKKRGKKAEHKFKNKRRIFYVPFFSFHFLHQQNSFPTVQSSKKVSRQLEQQAVKKGFFIRARQQMSTWLASRFTYLPSAENVVPNRSAPKINVKISKAPFNTHQTVSGGKITKTHKHLKERKERGEKTTATKQSNSK